MAARGKFVIGLLLVVGTVLTACGSAGPATDGADRSFLQRMIPHHERAIAVARIGVADATDPRVRAFAARIVREQTPELGRMRTDAKDLGLDFAAGSDEAKDRISDTQTAALRSLHGVAFDRQFLRLHITSETGAAEMADMEIAGGSDRDAVDLARGIGSAPRTQIPELRRLLTAIGG